MVTIRVAMAQELQDPDVENRRQFVFAVIYYAGSCAKSDLVRYRNGEAWWMVELCIDGDDVDITQHPMIGVEVFCAASWYVGCTLLGSCQVPMPRYGLPFQELALLSQNEATTGKLLVFVDATAQWSAADVERDLEHLSALTVAPHKNHKESPSEVTPHTAELSPRYASEGSTVDENDDECGNISNETSPNDSKPLWALVGRLAKAFYG